MLPLTFSWEPLAALLDEGLDQIVLEHWREIARDQADVPLVVDWDEYQRQEDLGQWKAFVARRGDTMVAYIAFFLYHPARYQKTMYVCDDTVWVLPSEGKNRGLVWYKLIKAAMAALPRPIKFQVKAREPRVEAILQRLGLKRSEVVYSAYLT